MLCSIPWQQENYIHLTVQASGSRKTFSPTCTWNIVSDSRFHKCIGLYQVRQQQAAAQGEAANPEQVQQLPQQTRRTPPVHERARQLGGLFGQQDAFKRQRRVMGNNMIQQQALPRQLPQTPYNVVVAWAATMARPRQNHLASQGIVRGVSSGMVMPAGQPSVSSQNRLAAEERAKKQRRLET